MAAGISKISALKRVTAVVEHRDGGEAGTTRKITGLHPLRAHHHRTRRDPRPRIRARANKVWDLHAGLGAEISLKDFRKDIILELYNEAGQLALAYKIYRC